MSAQSRLHKIVEDGLCIGCGICAALAPQDIKIARGDDGDLRPIAGTDLSDAAMARIDEVCPSLRVEGIPLELAADAPHNDIVWGPYHEMSLAHASDKTIRHEASTAGLLTIMGIYLLESGKVDAILHVKPAVSPANFGIATISRTREEVLSGSGSRYGPTAALLPIEEVLSSDERFAVIAKPCDLNALQNLSHHDARVKERIGYFLTMLCGGFQPDEAFRGFLTDNGLSDEGVGAVRYRGFGCPGPTTIDYEDGSRAAFHYLDFWGEDESQWSMPLRCKICPDGIGEAADLVAGDAWDGASPDREDSLTDEGYNTVIARTKKGYDLYEEAIKAGVVTKTQTVDCAFMSNVQPHQVTKKLAGQARSDGLRQAGSVAPKLVNMRADALSEKLGKQDYDAQKEGSYRRALNRRMS